MRITIVSKDKSFASLWTLALNSNSRIEQINLLEGHPNSSAEAQRIRESQVIIFHANNDTLSLWQPLEGIASSATLIAVLNADLTASHRMHLERVSELTLEWRDLSLGQVEQTVRQVIDNHEMQDRIAQQEDELRRVRRRESSQQQRQQGLAEELSHSLRTPLTVVREFADAARSGAAGPATPRLTEMLETIVQRTDDMQRVVDNLLDHFRFETGNFIADRREFSLAELLKSVVPQLRQRTDQRNVSIELDIDEQLPQVYCDREEIARVINQLAVNAINRIEQGGVLRLFARFERDSSRVVVGIADSVLSETHTVYRQQLDPIADQLAAVGSESAGLNGIDLLEKIVHANLGTLDVSHFTTLGTTIQIALPVKNPSALLHQFLDLAREGSNRNRRYELCRVELNNEQQFPQDALSGLLHSELNCFDFAYPIGDAKWIVLLRSDANAELLASNLFQEAWNRLIEADAMSLTPAMRCESLGLYDLETDRVDVFADFTAACTAADVPCDDADQRPATRVLVVDDTPEAVQECTDRLDRLGFQVSKVSEGIEGITAMIQELPDAIVLDIRQSDDAQLESLCDLDGSGTSNDAPIVILSASLRDQQRAIEQHLRLGAPKGRTDLVPAGF